MSRTSQMPGRQRQADARRSNAALSPRTPKTFNLSRCIGTKMALAKTHSACQQSQNAFPPSSSKWFSSDKKLVRSISERSANHGPFAGPGTAGQVPY